jgi:CBS domain-containing protein
MPTGRTVEDLMTRDPACCTPDDGVVECAKFMAREDVGVVPVVESQDTRRLVGVITDRDLALGVIAEGRDPAATRVEECMNDEVVTVRPTDTLEEAEEQMRQNEVHGICVVDDSFACVGVIAEADILRASRVKTTHGDVPRPHQ